MAEVNDVHLHGRVIITGHIQVLTGLHIGAGEEGVKIGGVEQNAVMRDTLTNEPYIPGSSLKGKLRSLAEKRDPKARMDWPIGQVVKIHVCSAPDAYRQCHICRIFGIPGQLKSSAPTRLVVRDVHLAPESRSRLLSAETDLPFTEVKYEAAIDRVTSEAVPRPLERVPAEAIFGPFEMVFSLYEEGDVDLLPRLFETMRLLEDDYLGGSGSRGSGKVRFENVQVAVKSVDAYAEEKPDIPTVSAPDLEALTGKLSSVTGLVREKVRFSEEPAGRETADDG